MKVVSWKTIITLVAIGLLGSPSLAAIISIRLIKDKPSRCSENPVLYFLTNKSGFSQVDKPWYNGENNLEVFFEVETQATEILKASIKIYAPGVKVVKALIGKTDVPFKQQGDNYFLEIVNDTTDGRHVATTYINPKSNTPISFYHNWKDRVSGDYTKISYPEKALAASCNYALACQEMLYLMGDMNGSNQKFIGKFKIINCESSAPRNHVDYPPHWHLEHLEPDYDASHVLQYRKKQYIIPHYYLDSIGNILKDKIGVTQNYIKLKLKKNLYLPGDTCTWNDVEGNLIFKQVIVNGGLKFIRPDGVSWSLMPDKQKGGSGAVWIYKETVPVACVTVNDDGAHGITKMKIIYYKKEGTEATWSDEFKYDPLTGIQIK